MNWRLFIVLFVLAALAIPGLSYVEERFTLPRVINESTNIVLMKVKRVNKEKKLIIYEKVADLKGKHETLEIKHNVGVGGFNEYETKAPIEWAEVGKLAVFFHNGAASETCIGKYWYQCYPGGDWWNHSHGEPFMCRTYCGDIEGLKTAIEKLLKDEDVIVPATAGKTDRRIQKVKCSMKKPLDYIVVEPPNIEKTKLEGIAGFSDMIELPRPQGALVGAIPVDLDNDGYTDLLLVGSESLVLLHNDKKGNFEDWTDKWGLGGELGCKAASFADYNRSGRLSLFTSTGKLFTNTGTKFKDDSNFLPKTPERVDNPGEAMAWTDFDNDGLPDIICSVGARGLAAFRNTGGKNGTWFEDLSAKVGLGPDGLGLEPANYLSTIDISGNGKVGFILNLQHPLVVVNKGGFFEEAKEHGIDFPALPRPALAPAHYLNDGRLALFVTSNERTGMIRDWSVIGTFNEAEDKKLPEPAKLNPSDHPEIRMGTDLWRWNSIRAKASGALEFRRGQPSPNASYAYAAFEWSKDEKIVLNIGSENGIRVWLNGKEVHKFEGKRTYQPDIDMPDVDVKEGTNVILLKVFDEGPVWRSSVRPAPRNLYPPPAVQFYQRDPKGKYADITSTTGDLSQLRADAISAVWADLDNDGLQDLLVTSKNGLLRYYHNLGDGKFRYATAELGLEQKFKATGCIVADFNHDGLPDLVLLGNDPDPCAVLFGKLKGKKTPLTVRCAGPDSAIDALVKVVDGNGKLIAQQFLGGGDGRNLQIATQARFALTPGKYRVEVRYSSGAVRSREVEIGATPVWETVDEKSAAKK